MSATVVFCGEEHPVADDGALVIGREGDIDIDDNPYLHRRFLRIDREGGLWRIVNLGSQLSATVGDEHGLVQAWLAPGGQLPLVFATTTVLFTAGATTYELQIELDDAPFGLVVDDDGDGGQETLGRTTMTPDQRLLVVALAEPLLRHRERFAGRIPSSADAAARLGWTITKFNRKLDNVCQKLARHGVRGLHGDSGNLASNRRARLVEYALAARLVTEDDLVLLPPSGKRAELPIDSRSHT